MNDALPAVQALASVGRDQLWGLIEQHAAPAWAATYDYRWERDGRTLEAVLAALRAAASGGHAAAPSGAAPRFLASLVRGQLERLARTWNQSGSFGEVRLLERLGLVDLEHDDTYVLAVVSALGDRRGHLDRAAMLRADPALLEVVWRFFEVEGGGEVSLANVDKFSHGTSWRQVLGELVADGTLPRAQVMTCTVEALARDFSAYRAGWFSGFLESLEPEAAELAALQSQLRRLLGSSVTATAAVAARCLKKVASAGLLDDEACAELGPGLLGRTKGTALEVLRLLRGVAGRRPDLVEVVAGTAAVALEHQHADVQRAAVNLLDSLGAGDLAAEAADVLPPTVSHRLGAVTTPDGSAARVARAAADAAPASLSVPRGAELVEAVAALLERADEPMAVEAALAGLALDDPGLLAPLARRARTLMRRDGFVGDHPVRAGFAGLVLAAAGTPGARRSVYPQDQAGPAAFLHERLDHVGAIMAGRAPRGPLLATPTDVDGWIDPHALVDRLAAGTRFALADLVGGLLRLAPDDRPAALQSLKRQGRTDEIGDAVRHALGAPTPPTGTSAIRTPALWVAASRARQPLDDDPFLLSAGLDTGGQGRPVHTDLELRLEHSTHADTRGSHSVQHAWFAVVFHHPPSDPSATTSLQPTRVRAARAERSDLLLGTPWTSWAATSYPHDTEPAFSYLALRVLDTLDYWEVDHAVPPALTALAHHPGHVGPLGAVTAAAGLAAQDRTHRALAVDAVIALAAKGTLSATALAEAMRRIAPATRLPRWAPSLDQVAATAGSGYVVDVLTNLVPSLSRDARGLVNLLDVLAEESTRITRPAEPALRQYLQGITGNSGAAAAARRTLAIR